MGNVCYNEWKSRQHVKRQEDSYKEYVASSSLAKQINDALCKTMKDKDIWK